MPELPWEQWYAQDWYGEPSLASVDAASRGIWADAVNVMILKRTDRISGTIEQLSRVCRCRSTQMQVAVAEFQQFEVCAVEVQNECITLINRRRLRQLNTSKLRSNAASARWCKPHAKPDANTHAPSVSVSVPEGPEGSGSGAGDNGHEPHLFTLDEVKMAAVRCGLPALEAEKCFHHYNAQGWVTGSGVPITNVNSVVAKWRTRWECERKPMIRGQGTDEKLSTYDIEKRLEGLQAQLDRTSMKSDPETKVMRAKWFAERKRLKLLKTGVA